MGDITLTASTRNSLLSVQGTNSLLAKVQHHLNTGRGVNDAIDDAVKFFKSKGLTDRAQDFNEIKDSISQNIQMIKAASNGLTTAAKVYRQMKGLVESAKSADTQGLETLSTQWKGLLHQLGDIAKDSSYSGGSLLIPDPDPYPDGFDPNTYWNHPKDVGQPPVQMQTSPNGSGITVAKGALPIYDTVADDSATPANNLPAGSNVIQNPQNGHFYVYVGQTLSWADAKAKADSMVLNGMQGYLVTVTSKSENDFVHTNYTTKKTWIAASDVDNEGEWKWMDGPENGTLFSHADDHGHNTPINGGYSNWAPGEPNNFGTGESYGVMHWSGGNQWNDLNGMDTQTGGGGVPGFVVEFSGDFMASSSGAGGSGSSGGTSTPTNTKLVSVENYLDPPCDTQKAERWCDKAISYVNMVSSVSANDITLLQNRISFSGDISNTLDEGSDKMTLADMNEESASLVALQTRAQIGIQSVSISGQQQSSIINLLR